MIYPDDWYQRIQGATYPRPPMYCTNCGATLVRVERSRGWTTYGARVLIPAWVCPKGLGLINRLLMRQMLHSEFEAEVFGNDGYWGQVHYR